MDNIKNDKAKKEIEEKVSEVVKKDIERLLSNKEGKTPAEGLGDEWREALGDKSGADNRSGITSLKDRISMRDPRALERENNIKESNNSYNRNETNNGRNITSLKDRISMRDPKMLERERRANEKFQRKLSKINRQSVKDIKKNIKEKSRKIAERKKVAFKKKLKKKMKKKFTMGAKKGKSIHMTCLFTFMMFIAFFNDVLLDILVALMVEIIMLIITLTGIGAGIGLPVIAFIETAGNVIDLVTGIILTAFSLYIGGRTKAGAKKSLKSLAKYGLGFLVEFTLILNFFTSWIVIVASDWLAVRKGAEEAEAMDEKINQTGGN